MCFHFSVFWHSKLSVNSFHNHIFSRGIACNKMLYLSCSCNDWDHSSDGIFAEKFLFHMKSIDHNMLNNKKPRHRRSFVRDRKVNSHLRFEWFKLNQNSCILLHSWNSVQAKAIRNCILYALNKYANIRYTLICGNVRAVHLLLLVSLIYFHSSN